MDRPDWDQTWMSVALDVASRAPCSRARVGAVIVDQTNRIVATGYNGPPARMDRPWEYDCDGREGGWCLRGKNGPTVATMVSYSDCPTIHAEANALLFCDRKDRLSGTIYVTGTTCYTCAKLIANSGLKRLVVLRSSEYDYRNPDDAYSFLRSCNLEVVIIDA